MESQIFGKVYNVFTKSNDQTVGDFKISNWRFITIYENGIVYYNNDKDGYFLYKSVEEYLKREPNIAGLQYAYDTNTSFSEISSAILKDAQYQDPVLLKKIMVSLGDLFIISE